MDWNTLLLRRVFISLLLLLLVPSFSLASRFISRDGTVVSRSDVINDDLYAFGNFVEIYGQIEGDLTAFCYDVEEEGEILGNVNLFGYKMDVSGTIGNSARLFGNNVIVRGQIGRNLLAFGREIEITKQAVIERDLTCAGDVISIKGHVKGDVDVSGSVVMISGIIDGKVKIDAEEVYIGYPAEIGGDLVYTSRQEVEIEDDVLVSGEIVREIPEEDEDLGDFFSSILPILRFLLFVMALITGYAMILLFNRHTREAAEQIEKKLWLTFAAGLLSLILILIGAMIMTALIIGIPLAIILTSLGILLFYIGKIYVSMVIGRLTFKIFSSTKRFALGWEFLVGLIILSLVFRIPVVGTIVYILSFIIGAGAAVMGYLSLNKKYKTAAQQQPAPASPPEAG